MLVSDNGKPWQEIGQPDKNTGTNADPDFWSFHDQESACDIKEMIKTVFGEQSVDEEEEAFDVWLAIGKTMDLEDSKVLDTIVCQGELEEIRWKKRYSSDPLNIGKGKKELRPTILLIEDDVLSTVWKTQEAESIIEKCKEQFDPRYQFFDSSIWYRMISLEGDDFKGRFEKLLKELVQNNENKLYETISAIESLELQQRLLLNSYLVDEVDGHARAVVPFRFHSETMMRIRAKEIEKEIAPYNWGCVLIDDFAYSPMKCRISQAAQSDKSLSSDIDGNKPQGKKAIGKLNLIDKIIHGESHSGKKLVSILNKKEEVSIPGKSIRTKLTNDSGESDESNQKTGEEIPNWKEEGKSLIQEYSYADILIIDYLLGKDESGELQYGADLITEIMDENTLKQAKPFKKHWIFPIAVFNNAFASHLGEVGENNIQSKLMLAKGADPVTTPYRFRYQLFTFLKAQKEALEAIPVKILAKILNESSAKNHENHREILARSFIDIISPMASFDLLEKAKEDGSRFAKSYLDEIDPMGEIKRLGIHIQNIAYFIGYGSVQDTGKIRQELWRLKDFLNRLSVDNKEIKELQKLGFDWIRAIDEYVESLS